VGRAGRPKKERASLPPIWRLSDEPWARLEPVVNEHDPPAETGPERGAQRAVLGAVILRPRTGGRGNRLPKEYPDDSTAYRQFQRGVFRHPRAVVQEACEDPGRLRPGVAGGRWHARQGPPGGKGVGPTPLLGPGRA